MKKYSNSKIFSFILGAIIFGGIGVASAYTLFANNIGFTSRDTTWNVDNTKDAIDDLHTQIDKYCSKSLYDYTISSKISATKVAIHISEADDYLFFYCGVDGNYEFKAENGICKVEGLEENNDYKISIVGIDKEMNVSKKSFYVNTRSVFVMDYDYLSSGNTQGSVSITSNNPDSTYGLSITGTSDLRNYSNASRTEFIAHYRKWYKEIDLSNYNELSFYARKGVNHGSIVIAVDDEELFSIHYGDLDTNWHKYSVDISKYIGSHTLTIAGGYTDYTGSGSSNTQYYDIELR